MQPAAASHWRHDHPVQILQHDRHVCCTGHFSFCAPALLDHTHYTLLQDCLFSVLLAQASVLGFISHGLMYFVHGCDFRIHPTIQEHAGQQCWCHSCSSHCMKPIFALSCISASVLCAALQHQPQLWCYWWASSPNSVFLAFDALCERNQPARLVIVYDDKHCIAYSFHSGPFNSQESLQEDHILQCNASP